MNLILFQPHETGQPLPRTDPRARHVLEVLQRRPGDQFDVGLQNGPRGKATVAALTAESLTLEFAWAAIPPALDPITLIIGLPRPQTAQKILREVTALGVAALHFVITGKGELAYAQSTLWSSGEWERHLVAGAEQAFCTHLPQVTHGRPLTEIVAALPAAFPRLALDNYESATALSRCTATGPVTLALGPERGWAAADRECLRAAGFVLAHLGPRVLRVETAAIAAVAVLKAQRGAM